MTPGETHGGPPAPSELFLLGTRQLRAGHTEEAQRSFTAHETLAGTAAQTLGLLQQAERAHAQGALQLAAKRYQSVLERNPGLAQPYLGLSRLAVAAGELEQARVYATGATRLAPKLGLGWTLLGVVEEARAGAAAALPLYAKGVALSPEVLLCQLGLGRALLALGRAQEALDPLTAATRLEPESVEAFGLLGQAQLEVGQPALAARALERAQTLDPLNVARWVDLADALARSGDAGAVIELMERALARLGHRPALLEKAAAAALTLDEVPRAIGYLERELAVEPEHLAGWLTLANLRLATRDFEGAEKAARRVLAREPGHAEAWLLLGNLFDTTGKEALAADAFARAMAADETDFRPVVNLAMLYLESSTSERYAEAIRLLERAVGLAPPGEWRAHHNLALGYTRVGRRAQALELAGRIQREAPVGDPMVAEALRLEANLLEAAEAPGPRCAS